MEDVMTRRDDLAEIICILFKDINNVKPRHIDFVNTPVEELEAYYDRLCVEHDAFLKEEEERDVAAIKSFEAEVERVIALGAGDRETAIRWIAQANGEERDAGHLCWLLDLPYQYKSNLRGIGSLA
jgi:hypothetical protein